MPLKRASSGSAGIILAGSSIVAGEAQHNGVKQPDAVVDAASVYPSTYLLTIERITIGYS